MVHCRWIVPWFPPYLSESMDTLIVAGSSDRNTETRAFYRPGHYAVKERASTDTSRASASSIILSTIRRFAQSVEISVRVWQQSPEAARSLPFKWCSCIQCDRPISIGVTGRIPVPRMEQSKSLKNRVRKRTVWVNQIQAAGQ